MTSGTFDSRVCILVKVESLVFVLYMCNCDFGTFDSRVCIFVKVVSLVFVLYNCDFWYI